ncbi:MAG: ATP-binding cassette domain-containing protein [Gammaproteobacteria bacterium]
MASKGYAVELTGVRFKSSRFADRYILDNVSIGFRKSEFTVIVGPNGAGKSSILKAIAGELRITGQVTVGGRMIDRPINQLIDGVGIVHQFESADLIDHLSIAQNFSIRQILGGGHSGGRIFADSNAWRRGISTVLASNAHLVDFSIDDIVGNLSGGRKQMLSIAIAMHLEHHQNPCRLLLLDEHTSRLDPRNAARVMQYTAEQVREADATTVMVTHRYAEALPHADRVLVVGNGRICHDHRADTMTAFDLGALVDAASTTS